MIPVESLATPMNGPDKTQLGKYRLERLLGEGGMGVVWLAREEGIERPVALKLLNAETAASPIFRQQLAEEARLNARIDSPFVTKVYDHGVIDDQPFISMEFVGGPDLRSAASLLDFAELTDVATKIASGIQAAHAIGLVHRDLKPENIRLTDSGDPKILDFGLAREVQTDQIDQFGNVEGTLYYLSPEQLSGEPVKPASDLFSFGTILYELFAGRRPFEGAYSGSIIYSILQEDPTPPTGVKSTLPPWVDQLVMKLIAKRPDERFGSAQDAIAFILANKDAVRPSEKYVKARQTVTVVDLRNLSGDPAWEYFCEGFTDDLLKEIARRTKLVVSAQPSTTYSRDIKKLFDTCRSDYVIVGSLLKWQDKIKLSLSIFGDQGDKTVWDQTFTDGADNLFDLLSASAMEASARLAQATNTIEVGVEEEVQHDVAAYDYYLKGKNYYQTNKPQDLQFAIQMYEKALETEPRFALAHAGLSDVYTFQYMAYYDRSNECIERAQTSARKALEIDPFLPEAFRSLGRYYMFTGDTAKAEEQFRKAVEFNPKYAIGYRTLGWLKLQSGQFDEALSWARKALEMAPTDLESLLLTGHINKLIGKYTVALSVLARAIELGPDYGRAYYELSQVYLKLGALEPALEQIKMACQFKGDPNCYIDCGFMFMSKGDDQQAINYFVLSITEKSLPFVARYYLGLLHVLRGDQSTAASFFSVALEEIAEIESSGPANPSVIVYEAAVRAGLGQKEKAAAIMQKLEEQDDLIVEVLHNGARCYMLLGDSAGADRMLLRAIQLPGGPTQKELALDPHMRVMKLAK